MARIRVTARVMRGTVTDAIGGGNSGRDEQRRVSTVVTRPRLLVTLFRMCFEAVVLYGVLTLALVLPARVTTAAAIVVVFFVRARGIDLSMVLYYACLPTAVRLPSSPSCPGSGFKQPLSLINRCLHCLSECASPWKLRQWPRFSQEGGSEGGG